MSVPDPTTPRGTIVHADYRKWDGSPHWQSVGYLLGVDGHGSWVAYPQGTHFERPGAAFDLECDSVSLFPDAGFTPAFNAATGADQVQVYVDTTTRPTWSRAGDQLRVTMVALDLDVIQRKNGFSYVDDEDEFLVHQRKFGYPADVIAQAEADTRNVFAALRDRRGPFDGSGWRWLGLLREHTDLSRQ